MKVKVVAIDVDFSPRDRDKVYEYIIDRFGHDNVSYILTLGTVQDRGSIDVLSKGLGYEDYSNVQNIKTEFAKIDDAYSNIVTEEVNLEELEGATSTSPSFDDHNLYMEAIRVRERAMELDKLKKQWEELRADNEDLFYYFDGVKGTIVSKGFHPAGMIGSPVTIPDNIGVYYKDGDESFPVSFCSMNPVESLNYVKFDILGLKTVGVLQDTYELADVGWIYDHQMDWEDEEVWADMIKCGVGIPQFTGDYAFSLLKEFKPQNLNDMALVSAALRPSGQSYRDELIARIEHRNPSKEIDEILSKNHGYLVFQEDTIKFLQDVCGLSGSEADTTRRNIGSKNYEGVQEQLPAIIEGYCDNSGKPRVIAEEEVGEFIQIISDSSEYQFGW